MRRLGTLSLSVGVVLLAAAGAWAQVLTVQDFEGPLPGPQGYPGGYSFYGDGDENPGADLVVTEEITDLVAASVKGVRVTHQGTRGFGGYIVERIDPRGGTYYWIGYRPQESEIDEASDIAAIRSGHISVTPLHLDLTHEAMRRRLAAEFAADLQPG